MIRQIEIMGARYDSMVMSNKIYNEKGLLFLKHNNNGEIVPIDGISFGYQLLPWVSNFFNTTLDNLLNIIFYGSALIFFLICAINISLITKNIKLKLISILIICWAFYFTISETFYIVASYSFYFFWSISTLSIIYIIFIRKTSDYYLISITFLFSILMVLSDLFRDFSYFVFLIFYLSSVVFCKKYLKKTKFFCIILLVIPIIFNQFLNKSLYEIQKKNYYDLYNKNYSIEIIQGASWPMTMLTGLSFIDNNYIENFNDEDLSKFLKKKNPNYKLLISKSNNEIAKKELIKIFLNDTNFVFRLLTAKLGVLLAWLIIFSNLGLFYLFSRRINKQVKITYLISILSSFAIPIIAIPTTWYNLGLFGISISLLIFSILNFDLNELKTQIKNII